MDRADELVADTISRLSEWLEMLSERDAINLTMHALAVIAVQEREKAESYKMALKRCEIGK
jgi:hypothetical protein